MVQWTAIALAAIAAHPDLADQLGRLRCCQAVTTVTCPDLLRCPNLPSPDSRYPILP